MHEAAWDPRPPPGHPMRTDAGDCLQSSETRSGSASHQSLCQSLRQSLHNHLRHCMHKCLHNVLFSVPLSGLVPISVPINEPLSLLLSAPVVMQLKNRYMYSHSLLHYTYCIT